MKKVTFKRVDNGYGNKPSYLCSNGMEIVPGDGWFDIYKYYVGDVGFNYLKDAKNYCINH